MAESITIDASKCNGCLLCSRVCFLNYTQGPDGRPKTLDSPLMCVACGHCVAVCPTNAISHPRLSGSVEPLDKSVRPSYEQFLSFLKMRRSRREFKDRTVPREAIDKLLDAAAQAPNGLNRQNVRFTVIADRGILRGLSAQIMAGMTKFMRMLGNPVGGLIFRILFKHLYEEMQIFVPLVDQMSKLEGRDVVMYNAPCLIMIHTPKHDICGNEDSLYCAANILLAAETLGLGACVIGFVTGSVNSDPRARKLAGVPTGSKVHTSIIIGYPEFSYANAAPKDRPKVEYIG